MRDIARKGDAGAIILNQFIAHYDQPGNSAEVRLKLPVEQQRWNLGLRICITAQ